MDYENFFAGYEVPKKLKETAVSIMQRFCIYGICDGMYICNRIAITCGIGDGCGHFTDDTIEDCEEAAVALQSAYGCNISKKDIPELISILERLTVSGCEYSFEYQLLSRLKSDCQYFLGNGNRHEKYLWGLTVADHIAKMKELYQLLPVKPEWLTLEEIHSFEEKMEVNYGRICY